MKNGRVLIIGGGIGGLTAAIALGQRGFDVEVIEREPTWTVYGVGIIQQSNVISAVARLGILEGYLGAGFGFDHVEIFAPNGELAAKIPSPKLSRDYPANLGIPRPALHDVLIRRAQAAGARIRLGLTLAAFDDGEKELLASFSDGSTGRFDMAVGADGIHSSTRHTILPHAPAPQFTGQAVWRHNFARPATVTCLQAYEGAHGIGLVPISQSLMYMYVTTPEPGNPRRPRQGLAAAMREKLRGAAPVIAKLAEQITDDAEVVYKPLEWIMLESEWHRGRVVLLGDAVHAMTPHLGQGAGMAIEDSIVLAEEVAKADAVEDAFRAFCARRLERVKYISERSRAIGDAQLGKGPQINYSEENRRMFEVISAPI